MTRSVDDLARRLNSATVHLMRALRQDPPPSGLAAEHRSALGVVVFGGSISIGALARAEGVGPPAMTKTVDILERRGLVTRERDPADARVVKVRATRKAKEFVLRGRDQRVARIGKALAVIGPTETARLSAAIGTVERLVSDLETEASRARAARRRGTR